MARSYLSVTALPWRSVSFAALVAVSTGCSGASATSPSNGDDGGSDATTGTGGDDGSTPDASSPADAGPDTTAVPPDSAADGPASSVDAPGDAPADHEGTPSPDGSDDGPAPGDAAPDQGESEAGTPPLDASEDGPDGGPRRDAAPLSDASSDGTADGPADAATEAQFDGNGPLIRLFDSKWPGGVLGGRSGADARCAAAGQVDGSALYAHVRAFITVSDSDEIRGMPASYGVPTDLPIASDNGTLVASSWADLLDGTIDQALTSAGVMVGNYWYSGSNPDGSIATLPVDGGAAHPLTCSGWTDGSTLFDGQYGIAYVTTSGWMTAGGQATCGLSSYHVLCLGW